jgi:hypothetical protein
MHSIPLALGAPVSLKSYLKRHFVDKPTFAALLGITVERLDELIAAKAIPEPTYICNGNYVRSAAFGAIETEESISGEYFRPECTRWARIAERASPGEERAAVLSELTSELETCLRTYFDDPATIEGKIKVYLPSFLNGTFGLCVADPSTGAGIVRKEILQEKLSDLTENGSNPSPANIPKSDLLQLIDDYALSTMPFSPAEYARSSRNRLVDDLRPLVSKRP